jgi:hypothetical protein
VKVTLVPVQKILSGSELVSVGDGNAFTVFIIGDDVDEQPFELVTTTSTICPFTSEFVVYVDVEPF